MLLDYVEGTPYGRNTQAGRLELQHPFSDQTAGSEKEVQASEVWIMCGSCWYVVHVSFGGLFNTFGGSGLPYLAQVYAALQPTLRFPQQSTTQSYRTAR